MGDREAAPPQSLSSARSWTNACSTPARDEEQRTAERRSPIGAAAVLGRPPCWRARGGGGGGGEAEGGGGGGAAAAQTRWTRLS